MGLVGGPSEECMSREKAVIAVPQSTPLLFLIRFQDKKKKNYFPLIPPIYKVVKLCFNFTINTCQRLCALV